MRWRDLYVQSRASLKVSRAIGNAAVRLTETLTEDIESLRCAFNFSRATVEQQRLAIENLRKRLAAAQRDLTQAQTINAGHASWRRDAEAEYESVRQKLDEHFLLPHMAAIDMAATLARVSPVGGPPLDLVDGVRKVVHELQHLRAEAAGLRQSLTDLSAAPTPGTMHLVISWDPAHEDSEEDHLEIGRVHAEALAVLMASESRKRLREANERMAARLERHIEDAIQREDDDSEAQCHQCGVGADTAEAIRHTSGKDIRWPACPALLDLRALGRPVLDDSEGVA